MPKERRDRSVSRDRCRASPYPCSSSHKRRLTKDPIELEENAKEWEDARCPVCMEHPHNAVLLICSSHDKGCRPFMCDTSYRHSNCLDQFRKSFSSETSDEAPNLTSEADPAVTAAAISIVTATATAGDSEAPMNCENENLAKILCPLCRGDIKEWIVVDGARRFMNAKSRSCSCEACSFSGSYADLRKHARLEHPMTRPSEADPERERSWRRLERQRDIGDLLSTLQSSMGSSGGDDSADDENVLPIDDGSWLTVFFLIRVFQPGSASRSSSWSGPSRARARLSIRRSTRLWGESYEDEAGLTPREEDNESSDGGSDPWRRIRRRTSPDNRQ